MASRTTSFKIEWRTDIRTSGEIHLSTALPVSVGLNNAVIKKGLYNWGVAQFKDGIYYTFDDIELLFDTTSFNSLSFNVELSDSTPNSIHLFMPIAARVVFYNNNTEIKSTVLISRGSSIYDFTMISDTSIRNCNRMVIKLSYNAKYLVFNYMPKRLKHYTSITLDPSIYSDVIDFLNNVKNGDSIVFVGYEYSCIQVSDTDTTNINENGDEIILADVHEEYVATQVPYGSGGVFGISDYYTIDGDIINMDGLRYNKTTHELSNVGGGSAVWRDYSITNILMFSCLDNAQFNSIDSEYVVDDWDETIIRNATLVQELDRFSNKLTMNTLTFDIIDPNNNFNFGKPGGLQEYIKKGQTLYPIEYINNEKLELGKFFISDIRWENNIAKFTATSYLGLLDRVDFNEGEVYESVNAAIIINKIFQVANIPRDEYTIINIVGMKKLSGTIKPCTCRQALQQVLFAIHGVIDTTQDNKIIIREPVRLIRAPIPRSEKFSTKVNRTDYVSEVELSYSTYKLDTEVSDLYQETKEPGTYTLRFDNPVQVSSLTITGGTIVTARPYYVVFEVTTAGEVCVSGKVYEELTYAVNVERPNIDENETPRTEKFSTTLLADKIPATNLCNELFNFYTSATLQIDVKHIATENTMNNMRYIENSIPRMNKYFGVPIKRTFDLTGGFIDTMTLLGYLDIQDYNYYTTSGDNLEMYADDNFLI